MAKVDSSMLVPSESADGIAGEIPAIAYTEQVLAEKEAVLRKYIQDNYAKIQAVEKELEALNLEIKLTSGSKKAGLEHLRQKIEQATERVKAAKSKEFLAKKAWEAAEHAVKVEEEKKQQLCEDLRLMVQENALQQYERLEALTKKLDALSPEMAGVAMQAIQGLRAKIAPHGAPLPFQARDPPKSDEATSVNLQVLESVPSPGGNSPLGTDKGTASKWASKLQSPSNEAKLEVQPEENGSKEGRSEHTSKTPTRGRIRGRGIGRGRLGRGGAMLLKIKDVDGDSHAWTGAGFDVDDDGSSL